MVFPDSEQIVSADNGGVGFHSVGSAYHIRTFAWIFQFHRLQAWANNCVTSDEWNIMLRTFTLKSTEHDAGRDLTRLMRMHGT